VTAPAWLDVLDETIRACDARDRPDLAERLRRRRRLLLDGKLRVLVAGVQRQGKSQLVNALVNAPVCAVGDGVGTVAPTVVQYGDPPAAVLIGTGKERTPVPIDQIAVRPDTLRIEVGIPRALLASGLVLIDTPADVATGQELVNAALLVSAATHELTTAEMDLLDRLAKSCPSVAVVLTKTDIAPDWRTVAERDRELIARAGIPARVIAVSATLRLLAARTEDKDLNEESGFPALVGYLRRDVAGLAGRAVALDARAALDELAAPLRAELDSRAPVPRAEIPELQLAQRRLSALRRRATQWQNLLNDEIADLSSDVEYDLRDRTRKILRRVDEVFDTADPAQVWDSFADWLQENLSEAAERNFAWLIERAEWIAQAIAANFPADQPGIYPQSTFEVPRDLFDSVTRPETPAFERFTVTQKVHSGLRGSYGGVLMAGLITSLAGMPVINAVSIGVGGLFGTKSLRDESEVRLKRRQAAAKAAAQRHVDDFFLKFGKDCKDIARRVQRRLRDHFTAVTEELQETILESARHAREAVDRDAAALDGKRRELEQLHALQRQVRAVVG
jgi:hypothetical protein